MRRGLLLINLGTPKNTGLPAVRNFLRAFLMDRRVIDLPTVFRFLLVHAFILPFRTKHSAKAYQLIWTKDGSPLLHHSQNLIKQLQKLPDLEYQVALGMRYGEPSISSALDCLKECDSITILPLYPQYSSAVSGSSIEAALDYIKNWNIIPSIAIIRSFFQHAAYLKAQTQLIQEHRRHSEFILFSYHGIPERQIVNSTCSTVCRNACPPLNHPLQGCYKAQCYENSRLLAQELQLNENQYTTAFQSRLGKAVWIKPYTDEIMVQLAAQGIKRLVIVCPSFVTDCLETLEEIGIRARKHWKILGGEKLTLVPCLNTHPLWVHAVIEIAGNNFDTSIQSKA